MSLLQRRLANEWDLLSQLADRNPGRLTSMRTDGAAFLLQLHGPAAKPVWTGSSSGVVACHAVRVEFPVHFPAVPMEMYLATPVIHPNIHPETGFVCLWDRHRVSNTVEHALHRLVAMLSGDLRNLTAPHVMQPDALLRGARTAAMPLLGVLHQMVPVEAPVRPTGRKQRLQ